MIRTSPIARRYAKALLELSEETKKTPKVRKDLDAIGQAFTSSADLRNAFRNPALTAEMRRKVIDRLASRMLLDPLTKNTLKLMSDNRRLGHVAELAAAFGILAEKASGILRAEVTTPGPMPPGFYTKLQAKFEAMLGHKIVVQKNEDPELIAGVVTRIGDRVFDGSLRSRLDQLREGLHG